jgi:hypothetical protein
MGGGLCGEARGENADLFLENAVVSVRIRLGDKPERFVASRGALQTSKSLSPRASQWRNRRVRLAGLRHTNILAIMTLANADGSTHGFGHAQ